LASGDEPTRDRATGKTPYAPGGNEAAATDGVGAPASERGVGTSDSKPVAVTTERSNGRRAASSLAGRRDHVHPTTFAAKLIWPSLDQPQSPFKNLEIELATSETRLASGKKAKAGDIFGAVQLLAQLQTENRNATADER